MWVYTLELTEYRPAGEIEADWEATNPSPPSTGTSVAGKVAVITSNPRASDFEDFADAHDYVEAIEEERELPNPGGGDWNPPYSVANGAVEFVE